MKTYLIGALCFLLGAGYSTLMTDAFAAPQPTDFPQIRRQNADPKANWSKLTVMEKTQFHLMYKLAKLHVPSLTVAQYKTQIKDSWDWAKAN